MSDRKKTEKISKHEENIRKQWGISSQGSSSPPNVPGSGGPSSPGRTSPFAGSSHPPEPSQPTETFGGTSHTFGYSSDPSLEDFYSSTSQRVSTYTPEPQNIDRFSSSFSDPSDWKSKPIPIPKSTQRSPSRPQPFRIPSRAPESFQIPPRTESSVRSPRTPALYRGSHRTPAPIRVLSRSPEPIQIPPGRPEPFRVPARTPFRGSHRISQPIRVSSGTPEPSRTPEPFRVPPRTWEPIQIPPSTNVGKTGFGKTSGSIAPRAEESVRPRTISDPEREDSSIVTTYRDPETGFADLNKMRWDRVNRENRQLTGPELAQMSRSLRDVVTGPLSRTERKKRRQRLVETKALQGFASYTGRHTRGESLKPQTPEPFNPAVNQPIAQMGRRTQLADHPIGRHASRLRPPGQRQRSLSLPDLSQLDITDESQESHLSFDEQLDSLDALDLQYWRQFRRQTQWDQLTYPRIVFPPTHYRIVESDKVQSDSIKRSKSRDLNREERRALARRRAILPSTLPTITKDIPIIPITEIPEDEELGELAEPEEEEEE